MLACNFLAIIFVREEIKNKKMNLINLVLVFLENHIVCKKLFSVECFKLVLIALYTCIFIL
jgi:hypothetical protein